MAAKMKGIYKGFKCISQLFAVVKEREMEIGYPTDVKHVAHIGWDGSTSGSSPSWMSEFKAGTDSLSPRKSFVTARQSSSFPHSISSSQDFDQAMRQQPIADVSRDNMVAPTNLPSVPKKQRRKKKSSNSSKISSPRRSSASSRSAISRSTYKSAASLLA